MYLAYGRDLQAEEILKEALRTNSGRVAIHQKLLEIYAKRRDVKGFETVASQAYKVTSGEGAEWDRICDLGLSIDPTNPLYQPGGQPAFGAGISRPAALDDTVSFAASTQTTTQPTTPVVGSHPIDLDLDLDFSLDDLPPASPVAVVMANPDATVRMRAAAPAAAPALDLDFGLDIPDAPDTITSPAQTDAHEQTQNMMLPELDLTGTPPLEHDTTPAAVELTLDEMATGPSPLSATPANVTVPAPLDTGMMEFDLGSLSLDLGPVSGPVADTDAVAAEDPWATKLALADEFIAIGDDDGARALIEEVIAEASGDMKAKAQRALGNLN